MMSSLPMAFLAKEISSGLSARSFILAERYGNCCRVSGSASGQA